MSTRKFSAKLRALALYEMGDRAPAGSVERADYYRRAALLQREMEALA
jgi:hypothetical protein